MECAGMVVPYRNENMLVGCPISNTDTATYCVNLLSYAEFLIMVRMASQVYGVSSKKWHFRRRSNDRPWGSKREGRSVN